MNETQIKIAKFLDNCHEIEATSAQIYFFYANHFQDNEKVSMLWEKTAVEEESHAALVLLAKKFINTNSISINFDPWVAVNTMNQLLSLHKSIVKSPPNLVDALRSSIKMEKRLSQFHAEYSLLFEDHSLHDLFKAINTFDRDHVQALENALKEIMSNSLLAQARGSLGSDRKLPLTVDM